MTVRGKVVGFDAAVGKRVGTRDGGISRSGGRSRFLALKTNSRLLVRTGCLELEGGTEGHINKGVGERIEGER